MDNYEAKLLRTWIRELERDRATPTLKSRLFAIATYLSLFFALASYFLFERSLMGWPTVALLAWAAIAGASLMLVLLQRRGRERLAILAPHVSVESMKARLAELEA
jgi:hypothetical protein